jgi:hypothetical protein
LAKSTLRNIATGIEQLSKSDARCDLELFCEPKRAGNQTSTFLCVSTWTIHVFDAEDLQAKGAADESHTTAGYEVGVTHEQARHTLPTVRSIRTDMNFATRRGRRNLVILVHANRRRRGTGRSSNGDYG